MIYKNNSLVRAKKKLGIDSYEKNINKDVMKKNLDKNLSGSGSSERKVLNKLGAVQNGADNKEVDLEDRLQKNKEKMNKNVQKRIEALKNLRKGLQR